MEELLYGVYCWRCGGNGAVGWSGGRGGCCLLTDFKEVAVKARGCGVSVGIIWGEGVWIDGSCTGV